MKAFYKLFIADIKQFFRDRTALFFTFAFPLLFMLIFGLVFSNNRSVSYNVGLVNEDTSPTGQAIVQAVQQVPVFTVETGSREDMLAALRQGDLRAAMVIPADLASKISQGQTANLTVYYDPSQTTTSQVILAVIREVTNEINRQLAQAPLLLELDQQSIQSQRLRDIDFLIPGIVAMSILFLGLFGALPIVEWREKKVLKRFGATPIHRSTILASQVVYRLVLALLQTFIIIGVAFLIFRVTMTGNWLALIGLVILGTLTLISIGYFAVSRARTTEGAMPIIQLIQFPMLFLSGVFFPIDIMPDFMRPIVMAMPLTYLGDALRQVMVNATPTYPIWLEVAVLVGWLVVSMVLAIRLFRWE